MGVIPKMAVSVIFYLPMGRSYFQQKPTIFSLVYMEAMLPYVKLCV